MDKLTQEFTHLLQDQLIDRLSPDELRYLCHQLMDQVRALQFMQRQAMADALGFGDDFKARFGGGDGT